MLRLSMLVAALATWAGCVSDGQTDGSKTDDPSATETNAGSRRENGCPQGAKPYEYKLAGSHQVSGCRHPDGTFGGAYRVALPDGVKLLEGRFKEGNKTGTWTYRHPNGNTWRHGEYRGGLRHGTWSQYDQDGKLLGQYQMNNGTGTEIMWWDNGKPRRNSEYKSGVLSGPTSSYFESGEKTSEAHYEEDVLHGDWSFWDRKGQTRKIETWERGAIRGTVWFKDGVPLTP